MLYIAVANKIVNVQYRTGKIDERRQLLAQYVLLKEVRKANLSLRRFGFIAKTVDAPEFSLLLKNCRRDMLRYLKSVRQKEKDDRQ